METINKNGSTFYKVNNYFANWLGDYTIPINLDEVYVSGGFKYAVEKGIFEANEWHHAINEEGDVVRIYMTEDIMKLISFED